MHEDVTFVIGKLKFVSYQFVLGAFPLRTRSPLDYEMSLHTYTTYVRHLGSWEGEVGL